ncbi:aldehyde ferredoxin oxidoreductase N-terminal domain-containing protein, partial [Chloroflexota bacterium]
MENYGYAGNTLYVNLSTGDVRREPLDTNLAQKFIGGAGIGLRLLLDMLKPNINPLSPENILAFGAGTLVGTLVPGSGKGSLNTKCSMPASRDRKKYFIGTATCGSNHFVIMMKNAGYDNIFITGRAEKPSYLKVTDEDVEICDASDLWGKDVYETGRILRERHRGKRGNCGTWAIGQAGENLVRLALGWVDDWHNLGRFGGAIAGAKNLKAVVTLGEQGVKVANKKRFMELVGNKRQEILSNPNYHAYDPLYGHSRPGEISLQAETRVGYCKGCSGGICAHKVVDEVKEGKYKGAWFGGIYPGIPPYLHRQLQLKDYAGNYGEAFTIIQRANSYGVDLWTSMYMMSFVTKMYERGVLSKEDTGGLELRTGDIDCYLALLEKIVHRQDIGALMAEGWHPLCERLGVDPEIDPEPGCPIIKGVDLLIDARTWPGMYGTPSPTRGTGLGPGMGLSSIVGANTKQSHSATYWTDREVSLDYVKKDFELMGVTEEELNRVFSSDYFDTGRFEKYARDAETIYNSLGTCIEAGPVLHHPMRDIPWLAEAYSALTGFEITPRELLRAGERIVNVEKLLNVREGFS